MATRLIPYDFEQWLEVNLTKFIETLHADRYI